MRLLFDLSKRTTLLSQRAIRRASGSERASCGERASERASCSSHHFFLARSALRAASSFFFSSACFFLNLRRHEPSNNTPRVSAQRQGPLSGLGRQPSKPLQPPRRAAPLSAWLRRPPPRPRRDSLDVLVQDHLLRALGLLGRHRRRRAAGLGHPRSSRRDGARCAYRAPRRRRAARDWSVLRRQRLRRGLSFAGPVYWPVALRPSGERRCAQDKDSRQTQRQQCRHACSESGGSSSSSRTSRSSRAGTASCGAPAGRQQQQQQQQH